MYSVSEGVSSSASLTRAVGCKRHYPKVHSRGHSIVVAAPLHMMEGVEWEMLDVPGAASVQEQQREARSVVMAFQGLLLRTVLRIMALRIMALRFAHVEIFPFYSKVSFTRGAEFECRGCSVLDNEDGSIERGYSRRHRQIHDGVPFGAGGQHCGWTQRA